MSMGCSRYEYWSGLPCPPPGCLPFLDITVLHDKGDAVCTGLLEYTLPSRACLFKGHNQQAEGFQLELGDISWGWQLRGNQEESAEGS